MHVRLTVAAPEGGTPPVDVLVRAEVGTTLGQVRGAVLARAGCHPQEPLHVDGSPADDSLVVGVPPLVDGALLTAGRAGGSAGRLAGTSHGLLELHVVSGPDAGAVHRLSPGTHRLGRSASADVRLEDLDVSRLHAVLEVGGRRPGDGGGVLVRDAGSANGTVVVQDGAGQVADGEGAVGDEPVRLPPGAALRVGSSTLVLRLPTAEMAATTPARDGTVEVNRAPRVLPTAPTCTVTMPEEPRPPERRPWPVLAALLPLAVSIPMAVLWSPFALLFGLTSPVMVIGTVVTDRRAGRRRHRQAMAAHEQAVQEGQQRIDAALAAERAHRESTAPDAAAVWTTATTPTGRLWQRDTRDADHLLLRVGTGTVTSGVTVRRPGGPDGQDRESLTLDACPVTVPLASLGVLGVCGPRAAALGLARSLVAQVAVLHSPDDVRLVVLCDDDTASRPWAWTRWLPHVRPAAREPASVGVGAEQAGRRVGELVRLLEDRRRGDGPGSAVLRPEPSAWRPQVVVLLDGARRLRAVPGAAELLRDGPAHGIHLVCLDGQPGDLPSECAATVEVHGEVANRLRVRMPAGSGDGAPVDDAAVVPDAVSAGWAEQVARSLAPLRDATPRGGSAALPDQVRLLDLLPGALDADGVARSWRSDGRSTRAVLGVGRDGLVAPDLRTDGPHALVAGTTGAGKSELLQTLIASLAVANRPEELTFLLVDYKGGAAFADCARLPHTVGLVTDLDEHLTRRALTSLTAEVRRREHLLREAEAKDLEDYHRLVDAGTQRPLPRLVIVVDEFRVLAEELPEFVSGLVRLAAVGRSLGLHLVLATQRPAGVVGPDIAANVNLRIALRVRDRVDSTDVVEAPDAAGIDPRRPGRAMARTGSGPLVELQTARVGGHAPDHVDGDRVVVRREDWPRLEAPADEPEPEHGNDGPTDLTRLVGSLRRAAALAGVVKPESPWLPPLPDHLDVTALPDASGPDGAGSPTLVIGLADDPANRRQQPLRLRLLPGTALGVVGGSRSGRTGVLAAVAAAAARRSPTEVHLYAVAGPDPALAGLGQLPHTGAVVGREEPERLTRLVRRLAAEVDRRRARSAEDGREGHARREPATVLLVDGWATVQRALEDVEHGAALDLLLQVMREGPAVGISTVVTGDRSLLTGRVTSALDTRLLLRTADPTDVVLAGVAVQDLPRRMPPGRGVLVDADGATEVQVAAPVDLAAGAGPFMRAGGDPTGRRGLPFPVRPLPEHVVDTELQHGRAAEGGTGPEVPLGLGGEDVVPVGLAVADCRAVLVAGPAGSGRTTTLATLAGALLRGGRPVVLVAPRPSPLPDLLPGVPVLTDVHEAAPAALASEAGEPLPTVLVDDTDALWDTPLETALVTHLSAAESSGSGGVVVAGDPTDLAARFRGLAAQVRRGRTGVLLSPTGYADGDVLGVTAPRVDRVRPGRGLLVRRGSMQTIQVAVPAPGPATA